MAPLRKAGLRGKKAPSADSKIPHFRSFFHAPKLPTPPAVFGWWNAVSDNAIGMYGNDRYGDCAFAGYAHHVQYWTALAGHPATFTTDNVLSDYSAATGFHPWLPFSDQGTDLDKGAAYFRDTGIVDAAGVRHRVTSFVRLTPGDWDELMLAMYLFNGAGIGFALPSGDTAEKQFDAGQVWTPVAGTSPGDGHYTTGMGRNSHGDGVLFTWGGLQGFNKPFYGEFNDETICFFSADAVNAKTGVTREGFDADALLAWQARIGD